MSYDLGSRATGRERWRGLIALVILFAGSLLVAALVAPWALRGARALADAWPARWAVYLAEKDLPRYVDRVRWLAVLAGLPWLVRACGIHGWRDLGVGPFVPSRRRFGLWLLGGVATVGLLAVCQLASGVTALGTAAGWGRALEVLALAAASAVCIGFLEEVVFRGVVLRAFLRGIGSVTLAVALASAFFALVHFQRVPSHSWEGTAAGPTIADGLRVAGASLVSIGEAWRGELFLGLFLAGATLCLVVLRSGSLWPAVGLHAGWVWAALVYRRLVAVPGPEPAATWLWGSRDLVDGVVPLLLVASLAAVLAIRGVSRPGAVPTAAPPGPPSPGAPAESPAPRSRSR
jgi:membrane protease YdiL (CAAX protease family)